MRRLLALIGMAAALAGCSSGFFGPAAPNTLPGQPVVSTKPPVNAPAPVVPVSSAPVAAPAVAEPLRLDIRDQGLLDADRALAGAVLDQGLGAGVAALAEADAIALTPSGVFTGPEQIRAALKPAANAGQLFWVPEKASSGASADYGSTSGRYVQVLRGAEAVQGRYVVVWRKDGTASRWRIVSITAMPVRIAVTAPAPQPAKPAPARPRPRR